MFDLALPLMRPASIKLSLVVLLNGSTTRTLSGLCHFRGAKKLFVRFVVRFEWASPHNNGEGGEYGD